VSRLFNKAPESLPIIQEKLRVKDQHNNTRNKVLTGESKILTGNRQPNRHPDIVIRIASPSGHQRQPATGASKILRAGHEQITSTSKDKQRA
jgi:hypothetical protein